MSPELLKVKNILLNVLSIEVDFYSIQFKHMFQIVTNVNVEIVRKTFKKYKLKSRQISTMPGKKKCILILGFWKCI